MLKKKLLDALPLLVVTSLILLTLLALNLFKPQAEKKEYKPHKLKVFVEKSKKQKTRLFAYSQGEVVPKTQIELKSQVEGKLTFLAKEMVVGGHIRKGQTLIKIDDRDLRFQVIQKQASVALSKQNLEKVEAQARIAEQELVELGRENANNLAKWLPQLDNAKAQLEAAEALLAKAKLDLSRAEIKAPFTGVVRKENVSLGQQVNKNSNLATIYSTDVMEISLGLNANQLSLINLRIDFYTNDYNAGVDVEISTQIGEDVLMWPAKIVRTAGEFDTRTRTVNVIVEVHKTQDRPQVLPGLFVDAKITGKEVKGVTILARTSIKPNNKIWFVDDNDLMQVTQVKPVHRTKDFVVVKGLPDKTKVITSALVAPTPGIKVKTINFKNTVNNKKREREKKSEGNKAIKPQELRS